MKKLMLGALSLLVVTACTNNFPTTDTVEKRADLTKLCIKESSNPRLASFVPSLVKSLKAKGIESEVHINTVPHDSCKYMLSYALNERRNLVLRATVRVSELDGSDYDEIGEVVYKQRSKEEQSASKSNGVQGQTDRIVAELFKHY
ncbi:hypothetical protein [Actinobacillus suis]|uniref:Lipoprotein n=2 Tax=Actinobacillus suis TaxID=716 RepID=K0G6U1_ACTSU|nr:hypothetical protein [Actinobacillus suis]AFU20066.1 lipoprotein [Actinobacillus suis H91-0380]AIJ32205.1 lipoprotein [Actinobacillus suis ATCC 33415]MCO4167821.1 hypothetical protein [Actinobacillus suis]MCO4169709.1 hypothetical protein [Actinobacillus suis]MCQ9630804.1 hypothetical protein [Actinobacillus suis]